jgi:hypothetical protein
MRGVPARSFARVLIVLAVSGLPVLYAQRQQSRDAADLKRLLQKALSFVPQVDPSHVVVITALEEVVPHLTARGYEAGVASETVRQLEGLAEFTLDHRYPIFINAGSRHVQRILRSWREGRAPDQAARVLASDLHHEFLHAVQTAGECTALQGHVALLENWRTQGVLRIADPYITSLKRDLEARSAQGHCDAEAGYSWRSATAGSTRAARRNGRSDDATPSRTNETKAIP